MSLSISKINKYMKSKEIPFKTIPVISWKACPNQAQKEQYNIDANSADYFVNMQTMQRSFSLKEILSDTDYTTQNFTVFYSKSIPIIRFYIEYSEELEAVIIGQAQIDYSDYSSTSCGWQKISEFVITKDKKIFCRPSEYIRGKGYLIRKTFKEESALQKGFIEGKGYTYETIPFTFASINKKTKKNPDGLCGLNNETWEELSLPLLKLFNRFCNIGANKVIDITESPVNFYKFLKYKEAKGISKDEADKNPYLKLDLPEVEYSEEYPDKIAIITREDDFCILRTFIKNKKAKKMIDCAKIFVTKEKVFAFKKTNEGNWCKLNLKCKSSNWDFALLNFNKKLVKDTMLEYFGDIVEDIPNDQKGKVICAMLAYPVTEQLAKIGCKDVIFDIIYNSDDEKLINTMERKFGKIKTSSSVLKSLGVNSYQIQRINEAMLDDIKENQQAHDYSKWSITFAPLRLIKIVYINHDGTSHFNRWSPVDLRTPVDISSIDNNSFDKLLDALLSIKKFCKENSQIDFAFYFIDCLSSIRNIYGLPTLYSILPDIVEITQKRTRAARNSWDSYPILLYRDYLHTVATINEAGTMRPYFDKNNLNSIVNMHDMAIEVMNMRKNKYDLDKFMNAVKKCDKWVYSSEEYSVIAPKTPLDIANEGTALRHCAKSYIKPIADGTTNIMFIRKSADLLEPFFTVEIENNGSIQQVHGFCNRNADTEEGLVDFIKKWAKEKKLRLTNYNKVR